jgi:hypothetical protein
MKNKRLLVLGIALILVAMMVGVAFAEDEYEWTVEVYYNVSKTSSGKTTTTLDKAVYKVWAATAAEAREIAKSLCEREKGEVASCGQPNATGRTKGN